MTGLRGRPDILVQALNQFGGRARAAPTRVRRPGPAGFARPGGLPRPAPTARRGRVGASGPGVVWCCKGVRGRVRLALGASAGSTVVGGYAPRRVPPVAVRPRSPPPTIRPAPQNGGARPEGGKRQDEAAGARQPGRGSRGEPARPPNGPATRGPTACPRRSARARAAAGWPRMRSSPGSTGPGSPPAPPTPPPRPTPTDTPVPTPTAQPVSGRLLLVLRGFTSQFVRYLDGAPGCSHAPRTLLCNVF